MHVSGTFVGSQKDWATQTKEAYAIYMAFKKLSYNLHDAKENIACYHTQLQKFLTAHNLNSKVINWGTEIASMSHVTLEYIKGKKHFSR